MIEAIQTHVGQHRRYGDFFREWEIKTDLPQEEVIEWCFENIFKRRVPPHAEWHKNIAYGGERSHDMDYYFAGYYEISKTADGYKFVICEPYAD